MTTPELDAIHQQLSDLKKARAELLRCHEVVEDFEFQGPDGVVKLSSFFGDHSDLIVVHNMGSSCPYCTLWADGFSGYLRHLEQRAAFVVVSPDNPASQQAIAAERDWSFCMAQDESKAFSSAMGYWTEEQGWWPGYSTFRRSETGEITRVGRDFFGPGDDYCMVWPMFDLLEGGPGDWEPN